jgi:hypothetical protein
MRFIKFASAFLLYSYAFSQGTPPAQWTATSPLSEARSRSCAVRLIDGRILVAGGSGVSGPLASTEIYLPEGVFIPGPPMYSLRSGHTCTLLNDGRVLAVGGDMDATGSAEIFDPVSVAWEFVAGTGEARSGHSATLLPRGQVLIAGGDGVNGPLDSIEIFDPGSDSLISSDPALLEGRSQHSAVLLSDGRVMLVGGLGANGPLASTEIFDPEDFSLIAGPSMAAPRAGHLAVRLDDGRVLAAGGSDGNQETNTAEILGPATDAWKPAGSLITPRRDALALLIPGNGGVLIAGGQRNGQPLGATELFLPIENTFIPLGPLTLGRYSIAAAAIDAGVILATGGLTPDGPQKACGVLTVPAIHFDKTEYHIPETASASISGVPIPVNINFSLATISGSGTTVANDRLLTTTTNVQPNSTRSVPIVLTRFQDAGSTIRLTAAASNTITATATTTVRNATSLSLGLPGGIYEGTNTNLLAVLGRGAATGSMTGVLSIGVSTFADGTSNTISFGESANTTTTVVNTTGSAASVARPLTNPSPGTIQVSANYSGDGANDPAATTGTFSVVSKTPAVRLSSIVSAQAGVPFTVAATVQTNGTVASPKPFTGNLALFQSGFPITGTIGLSTANAITSSTVITPLTLNPIFLSATYSGDNFFRNSASPTVTVNVSKAPTTLTISSAPSYTCGVPITIPVTLSYPIALGLSNNTLNLTVAAPNGSVLSPLFSSSGLTVTTPGPKDLSAKATGSIQAFLSGGISSATVSFSGDPLLSSASATIPNLVQQLSPSTTSLAAPSTATNPTFLTATVASSICSTPPSGSVEFQDNGVTLGVVPLQLVKLLPFQESGSPTGSTAIASLSVSRPAGVHVLSVRYSGDGNYQPSTSTTVSVTFQ